MTTNTTDSRRELKNAKDAVLPVLQKVSANLDINAGDMCKSICEAMAVYGCRDQIKITKIVSEAHPSFVKIADEFFSIHKEVMQISERIDSKNYEVILTAIFADKEAGLEEKVNLADKILSEQKKHTAHANALTIFASSVGTFIVLGGTVLVYQGGEILKINAKNASKLTYLIGKLLKLI
ncbi:MAG: hypothetical protein LIO87_02400 [Eubacterium sp.]|nr:hypothetical protein [Eubacterium sp.]